MEVCGCLIQFPIMCPVLLPHHSLMKGPSLGSGQLFNKLVCEYGNEGSQCSP